MSKARLWPVAVAGAIWLSLFAACDRRPGGTVMDNAGAQSAGAPDGSGVVAVINGENLTGEDLEIFARRIIPDFKGETRAEWNAAIDMLINNRLLARKAQAEKVDLAPRVRSRVETAVNALWETPYWNAVVRDTVKLTDADFRKKAPKFHGSLTARQMVVGDLKEAESLHRAVVADPASFERLVREKSEGLTAHNGGVVSNITKDSPQYSREILDALFAMNPGDISPVMKSQIGYTFFAVLEKVTPEEMERRWRAEVTPSLRKAKELEVWEAHVDRLAKKFRIRVDEKTVKAYLQAREKGRDVTKYANRVAFTIDNTAFHLAELVDPSGLGVVHGALTLETIVNKRARQYVVAREAERIGLKRKFPKVAMEERYVRENILARAYLDHRARGIEVSDKDLIEYYRSNREKFRRPRIYEISAIETRSPDRLKQIYRALAEGKAFGDVADEWSDNREKQPHGKVGRIREDRLSKEFAPAVKALRPGEYAKAPVELPLGEGRKLYVVLRLDAVREAGYIPFGEASRDDLRKAVTAHRREAIVKTVMEELRRENRVEIRPEYYRFADGRAERIGKSKGHGGGRS